MSGGLMQLVAFGEQVVAFEEQDYWIDRYLVVNSDPRHNHNTNTTKQLSFFMPEPKCNLESLNVKSQPQHRHC